MRASFDPALILLLSVLSTIISAQEPVDTPSTYVFPAYGHTYGIRKAGPTELFLFFGLRVRFSDPQGLACVRLNSWEDPDDPHDDDEVTVYGVNSGQNNIIYNSSMWGLGVYGIGEDPPMKLNRPHGICANSDGDVYVADSGNHRIVMLHNPGHELEYVTAFGDSGSDPGDFNYPRQVCVDNGGNIYVSDSRNHRVQVFDRHNRLRMVFDDHQRMIFPDGIAVTDSAEKNRYYPESFIIVIDSLNQRISKYTLKGVLLNRTRMPAIGYSNAHLAYACIDYYDQIHITDLENHCLHKFDRNLNYIVSFGHYGDGDNEFDEPRGIAIYRRFGQLFIAEKKGAQYYWIGTDIFDPEIDETGDGYDITFRITEPSYISAEIFDRDGGLVRTLTAHTFFSEAGVQHIPWDGKAVDYPDRYFRDKSFTRSVLAHGGTFIPNGTYRLYIRAEATYSSRTYFMRETEKFFTTGK